MYSQSIRIYIHLFINLHKLTLVYLHYTTLSLYILTGQNYDPFDLYSPCVIIIGNKSYATHNNKQTIGGAKGSNRNAFYTAGWEVLKKYKKLFPKYFTQKYFQESRNSDPWKNTSKWLYMSNFTTNLNAI